MNIYPNESPLHQAFTHVASHADRVWWNEKDYGDVYKMANLNLYKNILKLSNRPANSNSIDLLMNNLENEKTMRSSVGAEQFFNWSFDGCERRENNNSNLMQSYQALFELLKSKDAIENNNKPVLPYNLETMDDIILYSSLHQSSVKNLWAEEKSSKMQEQQDSTLSGRSEDPDQVYDSELNANVPEFYPSVLVPPVQCAPRFPSVYDATYQADLFPFKDDANWPAGQQHSVNVLQNSELVWSYEESESGTSAITTQYYNGSNVPVEGQSTTTISHLPTYTVSLSNSYSLASADFPELPKTQDTAIDIIRKTNIWLEAAFPKKDQDFKKLTEVAAHFDSLIRQLTIPQQGLICSQSKQPDRRLYRDVLAQKETEHEEKEDGGLEIKYEELEREALAQYRASETSLVPSVVTELSPELEENLEREALEQYSGDFHLELADEMLTQSKCTTAEHDSNELESPASTSFDRDQPEDGVTHVKIDEEEKCMMGEQQTSRHKDRLQHQQLSQNYQGKNRNRQRRGNKKKRGKWKGGGGSSTVGAASVAGPREEGFGEMRTECSGADQRSDTCMSMYDDFDIGSSGPKTKSTFFNYCEEENKRLCADLKHKALNYLKGVDLNLTGEIKRYSNKNTIKQLLYKGALPVPIVQSVKLEEIEDAETYKQYAKEVATSARTLLLSMFKRIRTELMDTTTTGNIIIVTPTTAEKRKVRHKIQKCVRLLERADHLKRVPRKPVESARNEVSETLKLLHRTMEVVYGLKEITKTAYENIEYLRKSNEILLEIYLGTTFIKDKTEYIQQRIFNEARNILLVLLFPRREGYLLDRVTQRLIINPEGEQIGYVHRNYITDSYAMLTRGPNLELLTQSPYNETVRVLNVFKFEHHKKKDLWANANWEHWLTIGNRSFAKVDLTLYGNVNILLMMNLVDNLQGDHSNSRNYRIVSPNIINFRIPTTIEQYICYFCQMNCPSQTACINNEPAGGSWCVLNELNIRARSPLRLLMKTIFQGMKSSQCANDEHWPVTPATSCTRIVQTDEQEDSSSDENTLGQFSDQQTKPDSFLNTKQLPKKTRNNDSTCSLQ